MAIIRVWFKTGEYDSFDYDFVEGSDSYIRLMMFLLFNGENISQIFIDSEFGEEGCSSPNSEEKISLIESEKRLIKRVLQRHCFSQRGAAMELGISSRVLNYKVNKYKINAPEFAGWRRNN